MINISEILKLTENELKKMSAEELNKIIEIQQNEINKIKREIAEQKLMNEELK